MSATASVDVNARLTVYASDSARLRLSVKINDEYGDYRQLPPSLLSQQVPVGPVRPKQERKMIEAARESRCYSRAVPASLGSTLG